MVSLSSGRLKRPPAFGGGEELGLLGQRQLNREEAIEQPRVEQADADEHEICGVALDQIEGP